MESVNISDLMSIWRLLFLDPESGDVQEERLRGDRTGISRVLLSVSRVLSYPFSLPLNSYNIFRRWLSSTPPNISNISTRDGLRYELYEFCGVQQNQDVYSVS
ncbi:hypothetical protein M5689_006821 [Euphorbia peplus]|nr:hypothetical protein M5689_006821 [Euphorbia peplus]